MTLFALTLATLITVLLVGIYAVICIYASKPKVIDHLTDEHAEHLGIGSGGSIHIGGITDQEQRNNG